MNEFDIQTENEDSLNLISIKEIFFLCVVKWRYFAVSVVLCLLCGIFYLLIKVPVYTRSADLLVKDENKGASFAGESDIYNLGLGQNRQNVTNEMNIIKSPTLMTSVVQLLRLNEQYHIMQGLRNINLYNNSPIKVSFVDGIDEETFASATIDFGKNPMSYTLSDFATSDKETNKDSLDVTIKAKMCDTINTPIGRMVVVPTQYYDSTYYKETIKYSHTKLKSTTDSYLAGLEVKLVEKQSTILNLTFENESPALVEDLLNTLIQVYNEQWLRDKNQVATSTSEFITSRLEVIERELGDIDKSISTFKSEKMIPDVKAVSQMFLNQRSEHMKNFLTLNGQLSTVKYIKSVLQKKDTKTLLPTASSIGNSNLTTQINSYNSQLIDRNRLQANSSEKNPLVIDMTITLEAMQEAILQTVENEIESLTLQINNLSKQENSTIGELVNNPKLANYLQSEERRQKVMESLYLYLLSKREENELSKAFTAYNSRVVTAARGSDIPTKPRKGLIMLVALAAGLIIPAIIIYIQQNTLDTKIRTKKDLEKLNIPFAGEIPLANENGGLAKKEVKKIEGFKNTILVKYGSRNILNESFRMLRTNLEFMLGQDKKVIMTTSLNQGSGKSFVSSNMAVCLALKQKKVIVVDLDLRHCSTSNIVNKPSTGLSAYLNGSIADYHDIIYDYKGTTGVSVIPVGKIPPNPSELLYSERLKQMVDNLKNEYDIVILDCPPIEIVADADIVSPLADLTLVIVRCGMLDKDALPHINDLYKNNKYPRMTICLNGVMMSQKGYGNNYGYGYGYYSNEE